MAKVAAMTREYDTRIWQVVEHHVRAARDQLDCSGVHRVGMDETSARKGQDYVSIFADLDAWRVTFATEGRCAETVARFAADLAEHGGDPEKGHGYQLGHEHGVHLRNRPASAEREDDVRSLPPGCQAQ